MNLPEKCINCGAWIDYHLPADYVKPVRTVVLPSGSWVTENWKRDPHLATYALYLWAIAAGLTIERLFHLAPPVDWIAIISIAVGGSLLWRENWRQSFCRETAPVNTPASKAMPGEKVSRGIAAPDDLLDGKPTDPRTISGTHFRRVAEDKNRKPLGLEFSHYVPGETLENR